jgi:hypothetical protein
MRKPSAYCSARMLQVLQDIRDEKTIDTSHTVQTIDALRSRGWIESGPALRLTVVGHLFLLEVK